MYVDESGDPGLTNSPVNYFLLSGLVIHELRWKDFLDNLIDFRRYIRKIKSLKLREEIHSSHFITRPGKELSRLKRNDRIDILKKTLQWCSGQSDCSIINVVVDKSKNPTADIFEIAWSTLIQRFENTILNRNFPGPANPDERGIIISDNTDGLKLKRILRKMRRINYVPNTSAYYTSGSRNLALNYIIEDPFFKDSGDSLIHQVVDVIAYSVRQLYEPNKYMKKKSGHKYFYLLDPILCKVASSKHKYGIVEI